MYTGCKQNQPAPLNNVIYYLFMCLIEFAEMTTGRALGCPGEPLLNVSYMAAMRTNSTPAVNPPNNFLANATFGRVRRLAFSTVIAALPAGHWLQTHTTIRMHSRRLLVNRPDV